MSNEQYQTGLAAALKALLKGCQPALGEILVIGCSTSEVLGGQIGQSSSQDVGTALAKTALETLKPYGLHLAAQCCEHLNRALVVEKAVAKAHHLPIVYVVPKTKAGGSFATAVFQAMSEPVMVEAIQADYGLDIGLTMIGMHLKPVAVPMRIEPRQIGQALLVAARTRPKLIGGERAQYQ